MGAMAGNAAGNLLDDELTEVSKWSSDGGGRPSQAPRGEVSLTAQPVPTEQRRHAWHALSDLFLDTEHDEASCRRICRELRATGFSLEELDAIYADEVATVCVWNTCSVAGLWSGFDQRDLERQISEKLANQAFLRRIRFLRKLRRWWATRTTIEQWHRVREMLAREAA